MPIVSKNVITYPTFLSPPLPPQVDTHGKFKVETLSQIMGFCKVAKGSRGRKAVFPMRHLPLAPAHL